MGAALQLRPWQANNPANCRFRRGSICGKKQHFHVLSTGQDLDPGVAHAHIDRYWRPDASSAIQDHR
ncbi:hypothetical protein D3C79_941960 [compost metagenome]